MKTGLKIFIGIISALSLTECGLCYYAFYEVLNRNAKLPGKIYNKIKLKNKEKRAKHPELLNTEERKYIKDCEKWLDEQQIDEYEIISSRGKKLKGYCLKCENSDKFVLCAHGYRSDGRQEFGKMMKFYHDNGINVFFIDHQFAGKSNGIWATFGKIESDDCIQWLNFMNNEFGDNIKIMLHGISLGSGTVMLMTDRLDLPENVVCVTADCGYTSMREQFNSTLTKVKIPIFPLMQITNFYNKIVNKFGYDEVRPVDSVKNSKVPVLFIHGGNDTFVPVRMAYELYNACNNEKKLVIIPKAGHANSYQTNPKMYENALSEYIDKYLTK